MNKFLVLVLTLVALVGQLACSDESPRAPGPAPASSIAESPYGLKVWVKQGTQPARLVVIGPAGEAPRAAANENEDEGAGTTEAQTLADGPGFRTQATVGQGPDDPNPLDTTANDAARNYADGWTLTQWAIKSCLPPPDNGRIPSSPFGSVKFGVSGAPWAVRLDKVFGGFYFFYWEGYQSDHVRSCDKALFLQETLLCAADRLAQVADSPGTVSWDVPASLVAEEGQEPAEAEAALSVTIPPQAADDLFIAREMAFNVIAHINQLDTRVLEEGPISSCNHLYSAVAAGHGPQAQIAAINYPGVEENPYFDGELSLDDPESRQLAAMRRLRRKSLMLAGAARLTQQLVERSIEQDLAGAQQFLTTGGTSIKAARRAWGVEEGQSPANTIRHAVKTLFGRLEIGNRRDPAVGRILQVTFSNDEKFIWGEQNPAAGEGVGIHLRDDPRCNGESLGNNEEGSGYVSNDSLFALEGGTSARWDDTPPSTPNEAYATSLLHDAGIVFPPSLPLTDEQLSGATSVIVAELVRQAAMQAKPATITSETGIEAFVTSYRSENPLGKALASTLAEVEPGTWRFAIARAFNAFRLIADMRRFSASTAESAAATLSDAADNAGITLSSRSAGIATAGGIVVAGGLSRDGLSPDVMTQFGQAQQNANCSAHHRWGVHFDTFHVGGTRVLAFQNAFLLGQALERHLAEIASIASDESYSAEQRKIAAFSAAASAETRTWAGPGFMTRYAANRETEDPPQLPAKYTVLEFTNVSFADLGVKDMSDLVDRLVLTNRTNRTQERVQADCIAGLRTRCPTINESPTYVLTAVEGEIVEIPSDFGLHEPNIRVKFSHLSDLERYAVIRAKNGQNGIVLGLLPGSDSTTVRFVEPISRRQRELANRVFGLRPDTDINRTCSNVAPIALPSEYCIEGMQREQFVPLANSITSSGGATEDSFKHYLDVAEQAAARADELGRQVIELGLQRDIRAEAAAEEVSQICGVYPDDVAFTKFEDGEAQLSHDPAIQACVAPEKVDLVFLRRDLVKESKKTQDQLCAIFCGDNGEQAPFCKRKCEGGARKPGTPDITSDALGLKSEVAPQVPSLDRCQAIVDSFGGAAETKTADLARLDDAIHEGTISATNLALALGGLRLEETADGQWVLLSGGHPVMGSPAAVALKLQALGLGNSLAGVWPLCGDDCTPSAELLGTVFGVDGDDAARYPGLRRQVERALFFMGAMAGSAPEGVFNVSLPAVDRSKVSGDVAAPAFYAPARFEEVGDSGRFKIATSQYRGAQPTYPLKAVGLMPDLFAGDSRAEQFLADRQATQTGWRKELFQQAAAWRNSNAESVLFTEPVSSAMLRFDALLDPLDSTSTRDNLGPWLRKIFGDYQSAALKPGYVQQATFFRGTDQEENPLRFCARPGQDGEFFEGEGQELVRGRQICTGAPTSPVFYATSPALDEARRSDTDSCYIHPLPGHLFSTHRARAVDKGRLTRVCQPSGNSEACVIDPERSWEIGWFRLLPAVGVERRGDCEVEGDDYCLGAEEDGFSWSQVVNPACASQKLWTVGEGETCEQGNASRLFTYGETVMVPHDRLRPDLCPPAERVELFIESDVVETAEDKTNARHAVEVLQRALLLACSAGSAVATPDVPPPPVKTVQDMLYLEAWTKTYAASVWQSADYLYLVDVPQALVDVIHGGGTNVNAVTQGNQGQALLELEKNVRLMESSLAAVGVELDNLALAIADARAGIRGIESEAKGSALALKLARVEFARQAAVAKAAQARAAVAAVFKSVVAVAGAAVACVATAGVGCAPAVLAASVAVGGEAAPYVMDFAGLDNPDRINEQAAGTALDIVDDQLDVVSELKSSRIDQALNALGGRVQTSRGVIDGHLTALANAVSSALGDIGRLTQGETEAAVALAKASGADFVQLASSGTEIPLHVNTVYRRQFDVTLQRYRQALGSAKRAAYLARLAVEERLGVRLDDLHEAIGPLEAPSLWADDLCTVQGVNYEALRQAVPSGDSDRTSKELDLVRGFASQYVGDYVAQLREFVEFYNLQFPFADAQDVALISMRSDMNNPGERCLAPSVNLLLYSDQLDATAPDAIQGPYSSFGGWNRTGCDAAYCTEAVSGLSLKESTQADSQPLAPPTGAGGVTWLHSRARIAGTTTVPSDSGPVVVEKEPALVGKPSGYVFQTVNLRGGSSYLLSWWDQARGTDGEPPAEEAIERGQVSVFDGEWNAVALKAFDTGSTWSARRSLHVVAVTDGAYHVGFSPALPGQAGSIAIANVQLEELGQGSASPAAYVSNSGSRVQLSADCVSNAATFLSRFDYECRADGCWHVLRQPLVIDTETLNKGGSSLIGKVAQGNFNYRLDTMAVNLVGTGLRDCTGQGSACYGSGYVEYDLEHVAYNVPIEDYRNRVSCFDFGTGAIRSGKAIAAERFLTLPLGSADRELVSSSPFLKSELAGRPLSGNYRLRIKDAPGLVWKAVEDVQLIVNYKYWSRVDVAQNH